MQGARIWAGQVSSPVGSATMGIDTVLDPWHDDHMNDTHVVPPTTPYVVVPTPTGNTTAYTVVTVDRRHAGRTFIAGGGSGPFTPPTDATHAAARDAATAHAATLNARHGLTA